MPRISIPAESAYVEKCLRPLAARVHQGRELRSQFVTFAMARGGDPDLLVGRLRAAAWKSRRGQFTPFFALVLMEFAASLAESGTRAKAAKAKRRKRKGA